MTVFEDKSVLRKKLLRDYKDLDAKVVDKICSSNVMLTGSLPMNFVISSTTLRA